jgi:hypothetical protein
MNDFERRVWMIAGVSMALAACQSEEADAPLNASDAGVASDAAPAPDDAAVPDAAPPPDAAPSPDAVAVPDAAPPPDAAPEPEAPGCAGTFIVQDWRITQAGFPTDIFNNAAADLINNGQLVVALEFALADAPATLSIVELDPATGVPALGRPMGQPLEVEVDADGALRTVTPGRFSYRLYATMPYMFDLVATFHDVGAEGTWGGDCASVELSLTGAFANEGVSIPAAPDYDLDADGVLDAYLTQSTMVAVRR